VAFSQDKAYSVFEALDEALEAFRSGKERDAGALRAARDKGEGKLKAAQEALVQHAAALNSLRAGAGAKVAEVARLLDDKLAKVRRLHADVQAARAGGGTKDLAAVRAAEQEVAATTAQLDAAVHALES
jgi:hypothetical protein